MSSIYKYSNIVVGIENRNQKVLVGMRIICLLFDDIFILNSIVYLMPDEIESSIVMVGIVTGFYSGLKHDKIQ